jgi:lysylphosphatidylglycerol synthetase-like protein (DUF2156 family)
VVGFRAHLQGFAISPIDWSNLFENGNEETACVLVVRSNAQAVLNVLFSQFFCWKREHGFADLQTSMVSVSWIIVNA